MESTVTFALERTDQKYAGLIWCEPILREQNDDGEGGMFGTPEDEGLWFYCRNGGWTGRLDAKGHMTVLGGGQGGDAHYPVRQAWSGRVPKRMADDYSLAIPWIESRIPGDRDIIYV